MSTSPCPIRFSSPRTILLLGVTTLLVVLAPALTTPDVRAQVVAACPQGETEIGGFAVGAISSYVVPGDVTGIRLIGIAGRGGDDIDATGSESNGATGAGVTALFGVSGGETVQVLVGERGEDGSPLDDGGGGGGGGTFVGFGAGAATAFTPANLLLVAGGGGGGGINFDAGTGGLPDGGDAVGSTGGKGGLGNGTGGAAGSAGNSGEGGGASPGSDGANGAGAPGGGGGGGGAGGDGGDGAVATGGASAVDGGAGGTGDALSGDGGFGGGGGGGLVGGGGGGGYAGGGGGIQDFGGGGGSSFLAAGALESAFSLTGTGNGLALICEIRGEPVPAAGLFALGLLMLLLVATARASLRARHG